MKSILAVLMSIVLVFSFAFALDMTKQDVVRGNSDPISDEEIYTGLSAGLPWPPEGGPSVTDVSCITCQPLDVAEGEPICADGSVDIYNAGCNTPPGTAPVYSPISCNSSICGTVGTFETNGQGLRDTDWYMLTLTEETPVMWCATSEAQMQVAIVNITNGCGTNPTVVGGTTVYEACDTACVERTLPAGTYAFFAASRQTTNPACGTVYRAWLTCDIDEPCVCTGDRYESGPLQISIPDGTLDNPCITYADVIHTINVASTGTILDVNVDVNITHTFEGDLAIAVEHAGIYVMLKTRPQVGYGADCNNIYTTFDDEGLPWIDSDCPHIGCFQTFNEGQCVEADPVATDTLDVLSAFDGLPVEGAWTIYVGDGTSEDTGTLDSWALCITAEEGCNAPDIAIVDVSEGIPTCACVDACQGPQTVVFAPLTRDQLPLSVRFDEGCDGDPFRDGDNLILPGYSCEETDCPPAYPDPVSDFYYSEDLGGWCIDVVVGADGCYCVCIDDILPVELVSFDATPADHSITLRWTTASEIDNDHYEIMRDATLMGVVEATNSASGHSYSWTENNLTNGHEYTYSLVAVSVQGMREAIGTTSATPSASAAAVTEYALYQNYPNPFNPETNIIFDLVETGNVSLTVYNPLGRNVATLVNGTVQAGRHTVSFNAENLPSGLYFYRLDAADFTAVKKMILMK